MVGFNYHVEIREDSHFYSVPYRYAKKQVSILYTSRQVELWSDNLRIAFHLRTTRPGYTTMPEHRPAHHNYFLEWTPERISSWAAEISINVKSLVSIILERAEYPDQAFRGCVGIINFSKKYSVERLDMAARICIRHETFSYRAFKQVLDKGLDLVESEAEHKQQMLPFHENLRGQSTYQ
jgi:hypothetical protein